MRVTHTIFISLLAGLIALQQGVAQQQGHEQSFRFRETQLSASLDSLLRWYNVPLVYLEKDVAGKTVNAECEQCNFEQALDRVLHSHDLRWKRVGEQIIVQHAAKEPEVPTATWAGTVIDSLTGEWVIGASVVLQATAADGSPTRYRWCSTNEFGFFSLRRIKPGTYTLVIRSIGYRTLSEQIDALPNLSSVREFALTEQNVTLPEITIEGRRSALAASEGISRGIYIRATPSDANQYHLEGARIYNPNHYGGVISTFNGDALRDVQQIAGGVPPYYGGRIGGILDVTLREGLMEQLAGSAGIGSLGSHLMFEGPLTNQTSFLISGRRNYPDVLLSKYSNGGAPSDLRSSELMAKLSHHLGGNSRLFFSGYFGRDAFDSQTEEQPFGRLDNSLRWGNAAANLRWISVVSPSVFVHASAVFTRYDFDVQQRLRIGSSLSVVGNPTRLNLTTESPGSAKEQFGQNTPNNRFISAFSAVNASQTDLAAADAVLFPSSYRIEDIALRAHAEHFYDEFHTFRGGVDLVRHNMRGAISEFSTQLAPFTLSRTPSWELSIYLQDQWRLLPSVMAEVGARATSLISTQGTFSAIDPRFSLLVSAQDDLRFYTSLTSINQFVHPYRNSGIFLFYPTVFFYPSSDNIRPTTSLQVSLGAEKSFEESEYTIAAETYYRLTQKLHEFAFDTLTTKSLPDVVLFGEGTTYGAEFVLSKRAGDLRGSIRYSLSWANNRFAELNLGESYTPRFHRGRELYVTMSYSLSESWMIGAMCLLASEQFPNTVSIASDVLGSGDPPIRIAEGKGFEGDLNGGRIPGFQRLEFNVRHRFAMWGFPIQASLRFVNGYGLLDPFAFTLRDNPDKRLRWSATFDAAEILPLYPVMSLSVRF